MQVINSELLTHKDDIINTKDHLQNMNRKFTSVELGVIGEKVANVKTKYDNVVQVSNTGFIFT